MASRAEQKAAARAAREAHQREQSAAQARRMRLIWLGGLVAAAALAIVIVVVAAGGGGAKSTGGKGAGRSTVVALLKGIPQNGNTLGNPKAPVTVTEFGDLVCPICGEFALGAEPQLISSEVRAGKVKLVYRGLETASETANAGEYAATQIAARAAGLQKREWYYVLLFYHQQGDETTPYVTDAFLQKIAAQVPGLNLAKWEADRNESSLANDVTADARAANAAGFNATPSITFSGPKGHAPPISALPTYAQLQAGITAVS
jgi:protein-disulfide isomerase